MPIFPGATTNHPMKTLRLITALCLAQALASPRGLAINLPVSEDTYGATSIVRGVTKTAVTPAGGKAASLPVSKTKTAFFRFEAGGLGIAPANVIEARLVIYLPKVIKPGALALHLVNEEWAENFTGLPKPQPAISPLEWAIIPASAVIAKQFIVMDVTQVAKFWLQSPASDFGLALVSRDGTANVLLGAKEGSGSGYPAVLEIEVNEAASVFQNGDVSTGLLNGGSIAPGTIGSSQIVSNLGLWNRNGSSFFYSGGPVGIGTSAPGAPLDINTGAGNVRFRNDNGIAGLDLVGGGVPGVLRLRNSLEVWPNDAGNVSGSLDVRDNNGTPTIRAVGSTGVLSTTGRIGIGTSNPGSQLEIFTGSSTFQVRSEGGVPGINLFGGGNAGILRLRNSLEVWPNDAGTAAGHIDVRDVSGASNLSLNGSDGTISFGATTRQMINLFNGGYGIGVQNNTQYQRSDGGFAWYKGGTHNNNEGNSGGGATLMRVDPSGNLTANNLPGVEFFSTGISLACPAGTNTTIAQVTVTVPAAGYIILTATVDLGTTAVDYFFRLRDTTSGATVLTSTLPKGTQQNATLTFVVTVNGPGTKSFDAILNPTGAAATVGDRNFNAVYVPVRY
jgi:hypothetical protein